LASLLAPSGLFFHPWSFAPLPPLPPSSPFSPFSPFSLLFLPPRVSDPVLVLPPSSGLPFFLPSLLTSPSYLHPSIRGDRPRRRGGSPSAHQLQYNRH
jgi:hypothetical protein